MASTIPTIPYADVEYAEAYFAERMGSEAWDSLVDIDQSGSTSPNPLKEKALKHATRLIDSLSFVLEKTDELQQNEFPRGGDEFVPEEVMMATCEVALELLKGNLPEEQVQGVGIASESVGDTSRSYRDGGKAAALGAACGLPSPRAAQLLAEWIKDPREMDMVRVN